jgi:hypothetical protein
MSTAHLLHVPAGEAPPRGTGLLLSALEGTDRWLLTLGDGPGGEYDVEDAVDLRLDCAAFAHVVEVRGPRSPEEVAASQVAGRTRIAPAAAQVPGAGGAVVLRAPDGGAVIVVLGASVEALDAVVRAILSTPLLPEEDPALLRDPDRVTTCRTEGADELIDALAGAVTS